MKKNYLVAMLLLIVSFASAQIDQTNYRGAFAPSPTPMWTNTWTSYDPVNEPYTETTVINVTADITASTTWLAGRTYKLNGLIYVRNNATLTIQPGVVVKGNTSVGGTALIITKGAKLNAIGTETSPIVFTSAKAAGQRQPGDWGGLVILGKAGFNTNNGLNNIEGITANVNTEYGGGTTPINNDNSGTLKYVRIEFGGYVFSPNNEINGLTMGAVGNGTTIDYVQVSYANDDAFEWFGGSVNCKHLVSFRNLDDDFDTDNGYKGFVQYGLIIRDPSMADNPSVSTSEGFESDNNASGSASGTGIDFTTAIFTNITAIGPSFRATLAPITAVASGYERPLRIRRASQLKVFNSIFMDFKNNYVFIDGSLSEGYATSTNLLKFKNNIIAGFINATYPAGVRPNTTAFTNWFSTNGNTTQASSSGLLVAPYASTNSYSDSSLDYRPTGAATGASFTDTSFNGLLSTPEAGETPTVAINSYNYCKGATATPLAAALTTTGVALRWYTVPTGGTFSLTAPTPLTTVVGTKTYYVAQTTTTSTVESARIAITVNVLATPTEVIGSITGVGPVGSTSTTSIGNYVGTTSTFTYSIPAFVDTTLTAFWTVPLGVNIITGQGTNSLTVDFANVAFGGGSVGSIQVQAVNTNGCSTLAKTLALSKVLPNAPAAINVYDTSVSSTVALSTYAKYMGTTTPITLTATPVVGVSSYEWDLPAGVSVVTTGTPVTTTATFTAEPFFSPSSTPSAVGTKFWVVTYNTYNMTVNGVPTVVTRSTAVQRIFGTAAYGGSSTAPYLQYGTVVTSNTNSILVNFAGVTNPSTTALYLGVRSKNGVGYSVTSNTTNADVVANATGIPGLFRTTYSETATLPIAPSTNGTSTYTANGFAPKTTKLKKLVAALPAAPSALKLTNDAISTVTGVTVVTTYIGTTTPLTLTATPSATASSYSWELPAGVNQLSGGNSNVITINFAGVASGITSMYLGVKAVNGIGSSSTDNSAASVIPATTSTAKLLKVTAGLPAAPTTLVLTNPAISATALTNAGLYLGTTTPLTLTAAVSVLATSYSWELPAGVTQLSGGNTRIITVDLAGVAPGTVNMYFGVKAVNAVGSSITSTNGTLVPATSSTAKLLKITNTAPTAVTTVTGTITGVTCGTPFNYTMTPSALASSYVITGPTGAVVTSASSPLNTTNTLATSDLTFTVVYPSNLATVTPKTVVITSVNGFGNSTTNKTLTIAPTTIAALGVATTGGTTFTRCATKTISFPALATASTYTWTVTNGAVIVSGQGTNSIIVDFALVPLTATSNAITVFASTSCGVSNAAKTVSLTSNNCASRPSEDTSKVTLENDSLSFSNATVYPNPASSEFNIDIDASRVGDVQMTIYNLSGVTVLNTKTITLEEGRNTINENVSNLSKGIYIVRLTDASDKEVMVKKLVIK
jgi:hypothetical protein